MPEGAKIYIQKFPFSITHQQYTLTRNNLSLGYPVFALICGIIHLEALHSSERIFFLKVVTGKWCCIGMCIPFQIV